MKSTTLFALFLLSAFFTSYLPSAIADVVLDTNGDILQNGGTYYVLPVKGGSGGGLRVAPTGNEICPLTVVQSSDDSDKGIGTIFSSRLKVKFIAEGHLLSIKFGPFAVITLCAGIPVEWAIVDGLPEGSAVKLAAYKNTVDGWFKIEKAYPFGYKLVFCPEPVDDSTCGDLGIHTDHKGNKRLVVTKNKPLLVQFEKVLIPVAQNNLVLPHSE